MVIRRLRAHITRLVLVGAMTASVAVGSVAIGPQHEAAAMPRVCAELLAAGRYYQRAGDYWNNLGYLDTAFAYYLVAAGYYDLYVTNC